MKIVSQIRNGCRLLLLFALIFAFISGCGGDSSESISRTRRLLVLSDVHFNPFYDPSIFDDLLSSSVERWPKVFDRSLITEPSFRGSETNYPLLDLALNAAQREAGGSSLLIFPGDILSHGFRKSFFDLYGEEDEEALRSFVYKTVVFFVQQVRARFAGVPVVFALGNNDSYAGSYNLVAGGEFLADTASLFYNTFLLKGADPTEFQQTFWDGGYYTAELPNSEVFFVCLNTVLFSERRKEDDSGGDRYEAIRQLDWLEQNLAAAQVLNKSVWLVMHIPPGADIYSTVKNYMDDTGRISDAAFMWKEAYHERFLRIVARYRDVIEAGFAGHTHMDEYRLSVDGGAESRGLILVTPSVTPLFGNDPAFKIIKMDFRDWKLLDYSSTAYNLDYAITGFDTLYGFSQAYERKAPLEQALALLYPDLSEDPTLGQTYSGYYYSGRNSSEIITPINWPAYRCGISMMVKEDYIECVNSYR